MRPSPAENQVDDAFVQRFLTEGFCTITPDTVAFAPNYIAKRHGRVLPSFGMHALKVCVFCFPRSNLGVV